MVRYLNKQHAVVLEKQDLEENKNKISYEIARLEKLKPQLDQKLLRYHDLKNVVERINKELSLVYIIDTLVSIAFDTISNKSGVACLYLIDTSTQRPRLFATKKERDNLVIKSKEGDIFDYWVLKHTQPLFIEDLKKDFRFDLEKLRKEDTRDISSLIAAPLISEERILGILRLDTQETNFYTQDDLSFLSTLCDLGAVALENAQLYSRTKELVIHDSLTLLYTKGYFLERMREELERARRQGLIISLLMIDIDHFKDYNDKYGHITGDIILKNIGELLREFFEDKNSIICRFGGEEFAVLLLKHDKNRTLKLAEDLRLKIQARKFIVRRKETYVTISIGVSSLSSEETEEDLVRKADTALYEAKQRGRNRVCYF